MVQSQELRIGAVARQAGVSVDTVRYYERRGLLRPAGRLPSGYRRYTEAAVARIRLARQLLPDHEEVERQALPRPIA